MFAIIEDGGRQYRVQAGDKLNVDFRGDVSKGDSVRFDRVLAAGDDAQGAIGRPAIDGAVVEATILEAEFRGPKLEVGKFRRRKGYIRHNGHIQRHTKVRVTSIIVPGFETVHAPEPAATPAAADSPSGESSEAAAPPAAS